MQVSEKKIAGIDPDAQAGNDRLCDVWAWVIAARAAFRRDIAAREQDVRHSDKQAGDNDSARRVLQTLHARALQFERALAVYQKRNEPPYALRAKYDWVQWDCGRPDLGSPVPKLDKAQRTKALKSAYACLSRLIRDERSGKAVPIHDQHYAAAAVANAHSTMNENMWPNGEWLATLRGVLEREVVVRQRSARDAAIEALVILCASETADRATIVRAVDTAS